MEPGWWDDSCGRRETNCFLSLIATDDLTSEPPRFSCYSLRIRSVTPITIQHPVWLQQSEIKMTCFFFYCVLWTNLNIPLAANVQPLGNQPDLSVAMLRSEYESLAQYWRDSLRVVTVTGELTRRRSTDSKVVSRNVLFSKSPSGNYFRLILVDRDQGTDERIWVKTDDYYFSVVRNDDADPYQLRSFGFVAEATEESLDKVHLQFGIHQEMYLLAPLLASEILVEDVLKEIDWKITRIDQNGDLISVHAIWRGGTKRDYSRIEFSLSRNYNMGIVDFNIRFEKDENGFAREDSGVVTYQGDSKGLTQSRVDIVQTSRNQSTEFRNDFSFRVTDWHRNIDANIYLLESHGHRLPNRSTTPATMYYSLLVLAGIAMLVAATVVLNRRYRT